MPDNTGDKVLGLGVPLSINEGLEVRLKFTMPASNALNRRYGSLNPLELLERPLRQAWGLDDDQGEELVETDDLFFILGAGCLHEGSGLDADIKGIIAGKTSTDDEATRLGRILMFALDTIDGVRLRDAIAAAADVSMMIDPCRCEHRYGEHHFNGDCMEEGCVCVLWRTGATPAPAARCAVCKHPYRDHGLGACGKSDCACAIFVPATEKSEGKDDAEEEPTGAGTTGPPPSSSADRRESSAA